MQGRTEEGGYRIEVKNPNPLFLSFLTSDLPNFECLNGTSL